MKAFKPIAALVLAALIAGCVTTPSPTPSRDPAIWHRDTQPTYPRPT